MNNSHTFSRLAICLAAALAPTLAAAQLGDEFASDGGRGMPFANVPEQHPSCAGPVHEYWAKTRELDELFEQRKQSVNPQASELSNQINETAKERGEIGDEIIECVKDDTIGARPPLEGKVEQVDEVRRAQPVTAHGRRANRATGQLEEVETHGSSSASAAGSSAPAAAQARAALW